MTPSSETPSQLARQRYWIKRTDKRFSIFDRNIGIAILALTIIFVLGGIAIPKQIENNVRQATEGTLRRAGLAMLSVDASGQDVYISGQLNTADLKADIAKLHAIARGASCEVPLLGNMVCPTSVYLSIDAAAPPAQTLATAPEMPAAIPEPVLEKAIRHDFSIHKDDEFVTIDGEIPNEKVRDLMLSQATDLSLAVIDNMRVSGERASEYFPWALERAWSIMRYLEHGRISWTNDRFAVDGQITSEHEQTVNAIYTSDFFHEQLAGLKLDVRPVYNDVTTCNEAFAEVFTHETLSFEPQSAKILASSEALLDRIAVLAEQCTLSFAVENHTDASAVAEQDLVLSQRRAEQVVEALIARGIDKSRLRAQGFGSTRLKKNNNTPIERMQNRRTYIVAKQE